MKGDLFCIEGRLHRHDPQYDDPELTTDVGQCPDCSGDGCGDQGEPVAKSGRRYTILRGPGEKVDPRDPDYSREGIFQAHNCWKCNSGERPCVKGGNPAKCDFLHARND